MKTLRNLILLLIIFASANLTAQNYFDVGFAGANDIVPETILVTNLTKGTNVNIQGTDTLRLNVLTTSVQQVETEKNKLKIYPSPMEQYCYVEFLNVQQGRVDIQMLSIDGKLLYQSSKQLPQGNHTFLVSGVSAGMYVLSVQTVTNHITGHFVSKGQSGGVLDVIGITKFSANRSDQNTVKSNPTKQNIQAAKNSSIVNMEYSIGDKLSFFGSAENYVNQTMFASPTESQNFTFFFTEIVDVLNSATGKTWMDRNLGAGRAATSSTDSLAYGDLYQWGRDTDGHEKRNAEITSTLSSSDTPNHGSYITVSNEPRDWRNTQNDNLWQGVDGINNPCPDGYRIPTKAEWSAERASWSSNNSEGAFASPLKLPWAGYRLFELGTMNDVGSSGDYWSSTVNSTYAQDMYFNSGYVDVISSYRAYGASVRCIKNTVPIVSTMLSTTAISDITSTSATCGGDITSDGGTSITARGVVWSTAENPTVSLTTKTNDGSGTGTFSSSITGLAPSTIYYVRAYATNSIGTAYGSQLSFTSNALPAGTVYNPVTGMIWMDRNLGASGAATSSTDAGAYGDLYQWGRGKDGHEKRNSERTSTLSKVDTPVHGNFIVLSSGNTDWRFPKNDNLWQGVNGINNPCPDGFRIPTAAEWNTEISSWSSNDPAGAYGSLLKLTVPGYREYGIGQLYVVGMIGLYWSSTVDGSSAKCLNLSVNSAEVVSASRAFGHSVRCLKD